jgi:hypothetical protein
MYGKIRDFGKDAEFSAIANDRNRRIFLVAASSSEGLLTERRAAAQPWRRELAFMPHTCRAR